MSIMSIAIGVICTALMVGALVWLHFLEKDGNESENSSEDNRKNSDETLKKDKQ